VRPATASHPDLSTSSIFVAVFTSSLTGTNLDTDIGYAASPATNYWSANQVSVIGNYDAGGKTFNNGPATMVRGSVAAGSALVWGQAGLYVGWTGDDWSAAAGEFALVYDNAPATTKWGIAAVDIPTLAPTGGASSITWSAGILSFSG